jgi:hypothetical protein
MVARVIPSTTEAFREQTKGIENQFALLPAERVKEFAHQLALGDLGPRNFHDRKVWSAGGISGHRSAHQTLPGYGVVLSLTVYPSDV